MKYYVTTPIYYPSGKLHLGHVYSTVSADVINRIKKQQGYESYFLTGMDEHGEKIQKKAEEQGLTPQQLVDNAEKDIKKLWEILDVEYDMFSRTTDEFHVKQVQDIFSRLLEQDDIYLGEYKGLYCVSCETYVTETQAKKNKCPDCNGELKEVTEETYKFRCSKYQDQVKEMIEKDIINIEPKSRKNELLNSFFDKGIPDLAVTRTNFSWGIPVKENPKHVIYVWLDALTNYITTPKEKGLDVWPANVQIMGKEITRFHAIYWPMFLLALNLPMPDKLFAHGWLLMNGEKMSKSKKNVIYPEFLVENYSSDAVRYFLLREIPFGSDGVFTPSSFVNRYNGDLVNEFSNLFNRSVSMANKYFGGEVTDSKVENVHVKELLETKERVVVSRETEINNFSFSKDLELIWSYVKATNKFIDLTEPWILAKEEDKSELSTVIYNLLLNIRNIAEMVSPYMPNAGKYIMDSIIVEGDTIKVPQKVDIIFNRLDEEVEIKRINESMV